MKYSLAAISTLAVAVAAKPHFLNTNFDVQEGEPFTLKYDGCEGGCTILLKSGTSDDLSTVQTLTSSATGSSTTVTVNGVASGSYAFEIVNNDSQEMNYSAMFPYQGSASASSSMMSSSATPSSTMMSSTSSMSTTMSSTTSMSSASSSTKSSDSSSTTDMSSTMSSSESSSSTASAPSATTSAPDSGASRVASSFALVAGIIGAMAYIN